MAYINPLSSNVSDLERGLESQKDLYRDLINFSYAVMDTVRKMEQDVNNIKKPTQEELVSAIKAADLETLFKYLFIQQETNLDMRVTALRNEVVGLKADYNSSLNEIVKTNRELTQQVQQLRRQVHFFGLPDTIKTDEGYHFSFVRGKWETLPSLSILFDNRDFYKEVEPNMWVKVSDFEVVGVVQMTAEDEKEEDLPF